MRFPGRTILLGVNQVARRSEFGVALFSEWIDRIRGSGRTRPSSTPHTSLRQKTEKSHGRKKPYQPPEMRKLNSEQAKLILLARAWQGDPEASEFLRHLFPKPAVKMPNGKSIPSVKSGRDQAS